MTNCVMVSLNNMEISEPEKLFVGMDKEELLKYANDPFWVRLRWFLFIGFWTLWAAMLVGAVMIIYAAEKCHPPPPRTWWQEGPLAELPPDTTPAQLNQIDGNIKGLIIPLTEDAYTSIDQDHQVVKLLKQVKEKGTNAIIDLDPAGSHVWFGKSEDVNGPYEDYYIWRPPKTFGADGKPEAPNNWINISNKSSWVYSQKKKQFYYAPTGKPHLNFRNSNVVEEFSKVLKTFLGHGASGVRIRNAPLLLVDPKFENEMSISASTKYDLSQYGFYNHLKTEHLEDLGPLMLTWRNVVKNMTENGPFTAAEELTKLQSYTVNQSLVVDLPLKAHVFDRVDVNYIDNNLNLTFKIDGIEWPLWKANNHNLSRDTLDIVTNLLPGTTLVDANATIDPKLLKIRQMPSIMRGECSIHKLENETVIAYLRVTSGNPGVLVALNPHDKTAVINFTTQIPALSKVEELTVQLYSSSYNETEFMTVNKKVDATKVSVSPKSVLVLSYVPKKSE
ncbi:unnamed protein product [Acanthoscelides obtectus]|uniref:alpha-glucosidase n=1 Tax=Acanthoscelides obtectus TaxID=200917 RepID=A0A9P0K301_ACAOB|nr:unnamed protein product [Acanthoscelides obtectus]CAK1658655.1 Neutral and basic amino acid transport protein rBAT [Acanthoscelides obtectus]